MSNVDHARAWIKDHLKNTEYCKQILDEFCSSWQYAMAHLAGKCRRQLLQELFYEEPTGNISTTHRCCDVCESSALIT